MSARCALLSAPPSAASLGVPKRGSSKRAAAGRRAVVRATPEEERAAQIQAAMSDPAVAERLKAMEEAMKRPEVQNQMSQMQSVMTNPAFQQKMAELREDPELKPMFEEMKTGGMAALMKYMNDPTFLAKIGEKIGDVAPPEGAAGPPPPASPPPPPEINTILDAAKYGDVEAIEDFLAVGKGGAADEEGRSPLHYAVAYNQPAAVQALLDNGAAVDATDKNGNTALHYAAGYARLAPLKALLAAGADVRKANAGGQTPLDVVKQEPRNPLNGDAAVLEVLNGAASVSSLQ